jgi:DNA-binding MarR family transcriptional regulator
MNTSIDQFTLEQRVQRFVKLNAMMREATLQSEHEFLKLAGNISPAQLQIILAIGDNLSCTMSRLSKILHFSQANTTQMVDRLIQKKLLKRIRSKEDKRVVFIELLAKGKKIYELNQQHVARTAREWFSKMSEEEQEGMLRFWEKYLFKT